MKYIRQEQRLLTPLYEDNVLKLLSDNRAVIAGGAIVSVFSNTAINDYDVYCKSLNDVTKLKEKLIENKFILKVTTQNAYSFVRIKGDKILRLQLIKNKDFCQENINDVFKYFDFYCCMGAYDTEKREFILNDRFLSDNVEKVLTFNPGTKYPICSLHRTLKYQRKGYTLPGIEIVKMSLSIHNLKLNTYKDLKEQLQGIDTEFLLPITSKLMKTPDKPYSMEEIFKFFEKFEDSNYKLDSYLDGKAEYSTEDMSQLFDDI